MNKTILLLFVAVVGCNYGSSIADQSPTTSPTGSGGANAAGVTPPATSEAGGTIGTASGGEPGASSGGTAASASGGSAGAAAGGTPGPGTGGATVPGKGGTPGGTGGAPGTGGRVSGAGGAVAADAGTAAGTTGKSDALPAGNGGAAGTGGARGTGGAPGTGGATGAGGSTTACIPAATPGAKGMDTGQACLKCHIAGGVQAQRPFTAAGTLYNKATGGTVISGATVTITGSDNKTVTIVTGSDGNFYTNSAIAFPARVQVSKCPDTQVMLDTIANGNCNSCHDATMRIHLP